LLIVDEVQSGFGRAGSWFAISESGVRPDILLMAKARYCSGRKGMEETYIYFIIRALGTASRLVVLLAGRS